MQYRLSPFNPNTPYDNQVATELGYANDNFTLLGQAFYNSDPSSNPILRASYIGSSAPSNPVAGMTWLDTSFNPPVLKVYDGNNWQLMAPLNSSGVLDLSNSYVKSNVYTFRRVDLTNASSDYMLQVGEEAYVSFSNATSVPLHIATQNATYYEMDLVLSNSVGNQSQSVSAVFLNPNNTTYSNSFYFRQVVVTDSNNGANEDTHNAFKIGENYSVSRVYISNYTTAKTTKSFCVFWGDYSTALEVIVSTWKDTSTAWTSLGTISFPNSSSGYILVRRLA